MGKRGILNIIIAFVIIAFFISALVLQFAFSNAYTEDYKTQRFSLRGIYTVDGGEAKKYWGGVNVPDDGIHTVVFSGNCVADVPENEQIQFNINDVIVTIKINGETVFEYGGADTHPSNIKASGNVWCRFISPGIKTTDKIEISVTNVYIHNSENRITAFFNKMFIGSDGALYFRALSENGVEILISFAVIIVGVMIGIGVLIAEKKNLKIPPFVIAFAVLSVFGGVWSLFDANYEYMSIFVPYPILVWVADISLLYFAPIMISAVLYNTFISKWKRIMGVFCLVSLCNAMVGLVLQLCGVLDLKEYQLSALILSCVATVLSETGLVYEAFFFKNPNAKIAFYLFLPCITGALLESAAFFITDLPVRLPLRMGFTMMALLEYGYIIKYLRNSYLALSKAKDLEKQLLQSKISMMLGQIKPHFLFNSLNAISGLCLTDPMKADEAIIRFSDYLRANLHSIETDELVPFGQELTHVKNYVELEKMRYGEKLDIEYNILYDDFMLPTLSIQPIVENAIKHGISKRPKGGKVVLTTRREKNKIIIEISDNGLGFEMKPDEKGNQVAMKNIKERLKYYGNAKIKVNSTRNVGTTVTVALPIETEKSV